MADYYRYACGGHINRGPSVCKNGLRVARKLLEDRCLAALHSELLSPENVETLIKMRRPYSWNTLATGSLTMRGRSRSCAKVEVEVQNIMWAIKAGVLTLTTKQQLEKAEAEHTRLILLIQNHSAKFDKVATMLPHAAECSRAVSQAGE